MHMDKEGGVDTAYLSIQKAAEMTVVLQILKETALGKMKWKMSS